MAGYRNIVQIIQQGGGGGEEVTRELLQYDNRNTNRRAIERAPNIQIASQEMNKQAVDTVTAAVLGQANEVGKRAVEDVSNEVTAIANEANRKVAMDGVMIAAAVGEMNRKATDATTATVIPTADVAKRAVEDVSNTVTATASEVGRRQADLIETVIIPLTDVNRKAAPTTVPVTINYGTSFPAGSANATVVTTNWANPANAVDRVGGTSATLTATSSGLAGTTSNTTTGTLSVSFADPAFVDIPLGAATVSIVTGFGIISTGTLPLGQSANMTLQVSVDNGSTWNTVQTLTGASPAADRTFDITALIASDYAKLNALQFRANGSVTSGTGLSAQLQAQLFYALVRFTVSKTY